MWGKSDRGIPKYFSESPQFGAMREWDSPVAGGLPGMVTITRTRFLRADVLMVLASAPAYVATREAFTVFSPQDPTPLRYLTSAALLGLYLLVMRERLRLTRRDVPRMPAVALCGYGGYGLLLNFGQATVPAGTTSLLLNISPVFAFVLAYVILLERTTLRGYLEMAVAVLGVIPPLSVLLGWVTAGRGAEPDGPAG